jgi:hypothetical protein
VAQNAQQLHRSRVRTVDFLRGLALTIVLLDHVEWWSETSWVVRQWTPLGLGFSDAAEGFVALSGFTFGWVYAIRLQTEGFCGIQRRSVLRTLQIYCWFLVAVFAELALAIVLHESRNGSPWNLKADVCDLPHVAWLAATLRYQPFGLGILCTYACMLPLMPMVLLLATTRRSVVLIVSVVVYVLSQPLVGIAVPRDAGISGWFFNPFSWQLLFVGGVVLGSIVRTGRLALHRSRSAVCLAAVVVMYGMWIKKGALLLDGGAEETWRFWLSANVADSWLAAKPNLGPMRLLHFVSMGYLCVCVVESFKGWWAGPVGEAVCAVGRHSLGLYTSGVVLAYSSRFVFERWGSTPGVVSLVAIDAVAMQFALAAWCERRSLLRAVVGEAGQNRGYAMDDRLGDSSFVG